MDEDPNAQVAALLPEHLGHQLKLIVIHPHGRAGGRLLCCGPGESPVDPDVGIPPRPAKLRRGDHVVIQRPQRGIAEALVIVADLLSRQSHADQMQAGEIERAGRFASRAGPADPCTAGLAHDRFQGADQPTRTWPPVCIAARTLQLIDRESAGGHNKVIVACRPRGVQGQRLVGLVSGRRSALAPATSGSALRSLGIGGPVISRLQMSATPMRRGTGPHSRRWLPPYPSVPSPQLTTRQ